MLLLDMNQKLSNLMFFLFVLQLIISIYRNLIRIFLNKNLVLFNIIKLVTEH